MEYLLNPEQNRYTIYPIQNKDIWAFYKKQQALFWTVEEIDFSHDYDDFSMLNENDQNFIKMILAFLSSSDTIVHINLGNRFLKEVQIREATVAYTFQMMMESIHAEVYSLQIDAIIKNENEKKQMLNAIYEFPCILEKSAWAFKWIDSNENFGHRLMAFVIVEGVFLSGSFCSIFWLKKRNIMDGLCSSNDLIFRDKRMHIDFAILLYSMLANKLSEKDVHMMFLEAVDIEHRFIENLQCLGIDKHHMVEYIQTVADRLIIKLGYTKFYYSKNPFDFIKI